MQSRNDGTDEDGPDGRGALAGERGRQGRTSGEDDGHDHDDAPAGARRDVTGCRSGARTLPPDRASIRAATRMEGPRSRKRSLRTMNREMSPMRSAISRSVRPSSRIQAFSSMADLSFPADAARRRPDLQALGDALAVLVADVIAVVPMTDRAAARERLANRLDDQSRIPSAGPAAALLGAVANALMRLER